MRFDRLKLTNVRCFAAAGIPIDPSVTIILGGNGAGKTTIMEALACLTAGEQEGVFALPFQRNGELGEVELYEEGSEKPVAKWSQQESFRLPEERYLFVYGRYRRVFDPGEAIEERRGYNPSVALDELASRVGRDRTTTVHQPHNRLMRDLSRSIVALDFGRESDPRLQTIWSALNRMLPVLDRNLFEIRVEARHYDKVAKIVRNGVPLEISQLSDGYQALLAVIFDLVMRYAYLFLELDEPLQGSALVGIDEVDLHLHPRWQRTVISQLTSLFPQTQFVLTTHSPMVVQGAIDAGHTIVTLREEAGAVTPRAMTEEERDELKGAEVGSVLFEDRLFNLDSRYSPQFEDVERRVDDLQIRIASGEATDADHAQLAAELSTIEGAVAREDLRRADGSAVHQMVKLQSAFVKDLVDELKKAKG